MNETLAEAASIIAADSRKFSRIPASTIAGVARPKFTASNLERWLDDTLFVTYCASPRCNGTTRGALRLATPGRPVKLMAGGIFGWLDQWFELTELTTFRGARRTVKGDRMTWRPLGAIIGECGISCRHLFV